MRLPATPGVSQSSQILFRDKHGIHYNAFEMPYFSKILNQGQRENAIGSACFQSIKTSWSSRQACRLSAQNPSQSPRSFTVFQDPDHTTQPNLQTLYPPNGSLRQQHLAPSSWEEHGRQHPGFPLKLSPPSPF
uniref:Uncharacterized protein n=1 Tax=Pipistrellus kuhlii TaxID=59472 RepID=A0A7J7X0E5_PIPKU|nr:hypothetical protein mPipKuh1_010808 [Pipistrellus kuhlii]